MTIRLAALVCGVGLMVTSCGVDFAPDFSGPGIPECSYSVELEVSSATVLQLQAVPGAVLGPCINELRVGWDYIDQFAESGSAVFWLDSDRVGDRFLEVELTATCDAETALPNGNPEPGINRFVRIDEEPGELAIAVVPVAGRHDGDARALAAGFNGTKKKGRILTPYVDDSGGSASDRIQSALASVGIVLILDDVQITTGTVELRRIGHDPRVGISLEEALEEIEDDLGSPVYRAEWFHSFEGGCIVYRFDAKGAGSESIASEVQSSLGFYPLGELREAARAAGIDI